MLSVKFGISFGLLIFQALDNDKFNTSLFKSINLELIGVLFSISSNICSLFENLAIFKTFCFTSHLTGKKIFQNLEFSSIKLSKSNN
jgi:hypothetical protein